MSIVAGFDKVEISPQPLHVPIVDLSILRENSYKNSLVIEEIREACSKLGFFCVINHGISASTMEAALNVNRIFFEMPFSMREEFLSDDEFNPVQLGSVNIQAHGCVHLRTEYLKLYAPASEDFGAAWPSNPPDYRNKMLSYSLEVRKAANEIFGAIIESLNLEATTLKETFERGMNVIRTNIYRDNMEKDVHAGAPPHTDHSIMTLLYTSSPGLYVLDTVDGLWKAVPEVEGSLKVVIGNQMEVISNGAYKSALHRVPPRLKKTRLSIASFLSLAMDDIVEPALELIDEEHPKKYKGSSLRDFIKYLVSGDPIPFVEALKI